MAAVIVTSENKRDNSTGRSTRIAGRQYFKCANAPGTNIHNLVGYTCPSWARVDNPGSFDASGYHIDHIKLLAGSQDDSDANLQALCHACHGYKTSLDITELSKHRNNNLTVSALELEGHTYYKVVGKKIVLKLLTTGSYIAVGSYNKTKEEFTPTLSKASREFLVIHKIPIELTEPSTDTNIKKLTTEIKSWTGGQLYILESKSVLLTMVDHKYVAVGVLKENFLIPKIGKRLLDYLLKLDITVNLATITRRITVAELKVLSDQLKVPMMKSVRKDRLIAGVEAECQRILELSLKDRLVELCVLAKISHTGTKAELAARLIALDLKQLVEMIRF